MEGIVGGVESGFETYADCFSNQFFVLYFFKIITDVNLRVFLRKINLKSIENIFFLFRQESILFFHKRNI